MGRDYRRALRERGIENYGAWRAKNELDLLKFAWEDASEFVRAEFMVWSGLRPDPEQENRPGLPREPVA
jgi:hypothetical protein